MASTAVAHGITIQHITWGHHLERCFQVWDMLLTWDGKKDTTMEPLRNRMVICCSLDVCTAHHSMCIIPRSQDFTVFFKTIFWTLCTTETLGGFLSHRTTPQSSSTLKRHFPFLHQLFGEPHGPNGKRRHGARPVGPRKSDCEAELLVQRVCSSLDGTGDPKGTGRWLAGWLSYNVNTFIMIIIIRWIVWSSLT